MDGVDEWHLTRAHPASFTCSRKKLPVEALTVVGHQDRIHDKSREIAENFFNARRLRHVPVGDSGVTLDKARDRYGRLDEGKKRLGFYDSSIPQSGRRDLDYLVSVRRQPGRFQIKNYEIAAHGGGLDGIKRRTTAVSAACRG
jgi:hypothetical protein